MKKHLGNFILAIAFLFTLSCGLLFSACGKQVTLSFDAGEGSPVASITAEAGTSFELPLSLREGYVLTGWTQAEGGAVLSGTATAPDADTVYRAVWTEGYRVVFDAQDGVFAEGAPDPLTLAAGTNLYDAVKNIRPTKSGLLFGAWFLGEKEIVSGYKMPAEEITLTAHYKVEYAVEAYLGNLAGNAYVRSSDVTYASDYVGAAVTPDAPFLNGFLRTDTPAGGTPVTSLVLDADASRNVFRFYYDRRTCNVRFRATDDATGSVASIDAIYESTVTLPENGFVRKGYRFAGWSAFNGGEADYQPNTTLAVTGDMVLYAVWDRGYTDRYGSDDLIFFPRLDPAKAILLRGEYEFEGTREGDSFTFAPPAGAPMEGKVYGANFSYRRQDLAGTYTYMQISADGQYTPSYEPTRTLTVDEYLNATYKNGNRTYRGSATYSDETGDYIFSGDGENFRFLPIKSDRYEYEETFLIGGAEVGAYLDFVMVDPNEGMGYVAETMMLLLDGYGSAMLGDLSTYLTYEGGYYVESVYTQGELELYRIVCYFDDPDGFLTGVEGSRVMNFVYTLPLDTPEFDGYVSADRFRGEYSDGEGNTLRLDGFGIFSDSFLYSENGTERRGMYSVSTDLMSGSVVHCYCDDGEEFVFAVDLSTETFFKPQPLIDGDYTEYRFMDGDSLQPPFLILYDVHAAGNGTEGKADVYLPSEDGSVLVKAAGGTFVSSPIGNASRFSLYTFTRTSVTAGYENAIPTRLVFYNSYVTSATDYLSYNVYCVLEETVNGETTSYRRDYAVTDGGSILVCSSVNTGGLGALYIDRNGTVREGQFTLGSGEHFGGTLGTFLYATEDGDLVELLFDITQSDDGTYRASPRTGSEVMLYEVRPTGVEAGGVGARMIFLDGVSRMQYTEDRGENFLEGSYRSVGTTFFGETVYAFIVSGSERFRFVMYTLPEYDDALLAIRYDDEFAEALGASLEGFTFEGDGSLTLDGYHSATLDLGDGTVLRGNYFRDAFFQTVTFTAVNGDQYMLELDLENASFVCVDWATGRRWQLLDNNYEPINRYYAVFEDTALEKRVRIQTESGQDVSVGRYVVLDSVNETWGHTDYLLRGVTLGKGYPQGNYRVTFAINSEGVGACLVFNADASGVFTDEHWNVLVLDGFGVGALYTADFSGSGTYEVIDFDRDFISFTLDDGAVSGQFYFRLSAGVFYSTDYEALSGVFFSDSLESIAFGADGTAYLGSASGPYDVAAGKAYVYLGDTPTVVDAPSGDTYTYRDKTYRRWDGAPFVLNGTVLLQDGNGKPAEGYSDLSATLTFTPNGTTNADLSALFTFAGYEGEYQGYTLRFYAAGDSLMGETAGEFSPTVAYGNHRYPIAFSYRNGAYTFAVTAGYNSVEYLDHNARYYPDTSEVSVPRGGRLFKTSFGFGAIELKEPTISGDLLYLYRAGDAVYEQPLHFEDVPEKNVQVVGYVPGYGDRLELLFRASDGKDYLLNYYEYYQGGNYFWCYGFFSYQDVEAEEYTVRVKTLLYTKMSIAPGYFDAQNGSGKALGKVSSVTLLDKETQSPVVAYDTGITPNGYDNGVWLVDKADVTEHGSTGTCTWGTGYLVTFTLAQDRSVTAASVTRYRFAQVVNYMQHLVNLFFDEDGRILLASVLVYNGDFGRYEFVSDPHDLVQNGDGSFSFEATWDGETSRYTVTVEDAEAVVFEDENGERVTEPGYAVTVTVE